ACGAPEPPPPAAALRPAEISHPVKTISAPVPVMSPPSGISILPIPSTARNSAARRAYTGAPGESHAFRFVLGLVIPAQAGIQGQPLCRVHRTPASAGVTGGMLLSTAMRLTAIAL